jgi:hypothetical protein
MNSNDSQLNVFTEPPTSPRRFLHEIPGPPSLLAVVHMNEKTRIIGEIVGNIRWIPDHNI